MVDPVVTNRDGAPVEAPEHVPAAPADPANPDARRAEAAPVAPAAPENQPTDDGKPEYVNPRDLIAKRFQERRAAHDQQFMGDHKPPFVEHGEQQQTQNDQQSAPQTPPAPAAEEGFTLKVRGRDIKVASRDELLRMAEVEPHEAADFTDAQLTRLAQKHAAAHSYIEEGKSFRDQARVPAPQPATPQASDQQAPTDKPAEVKSLQDLLIDATNKMQLGTPEEAAEAWQAYYDRREADLTAARDAKSREVAIQQSINSDVQRFAEANQDIAADEDAAQFLYLSASREMANDLRNLGVTDQQLAPALQNPQEMARLYNMAREQGFNVRANAAILDAAGERVRAKLNMPRQQGQQQPTPSATSPRLEEKRQLQAQPTRSGHLAQEPQAPFDIDRSRKAAIEKMMNGRKAPNVPQGIGT